MRSLETTPDADEEQSTVVASTPKAVGPAAVPLVVDLDGTLVRSDLLLESIAILLKRSFLSILFLPLWLMRGKAAFKAEIARRVELDLARLPFNQPLIDRLRQEKARGRPIFLATGSHETLARRVADRLGLFDDVLASDGRTNLTSHNKLAMLRERFGATGFDYAGNAVADYPIWRAARLATVVNAPARVAAWAASNANVDHVFPRPSPGLGIYFRAMRIHQWLKNLLLFVPLITAPRLIGLETLTQVSLGFLAFGLCASSVYLLNDIVDLDDDRRHPRKRARPFASGELPLMHGFVMVPLLLMGAALLTPFLPKLFGVVLLAYYAMTLGYTFALKRHEGTDVMMLALLYATRIFAGGAAAGITISLWLLTFAIFIFLSLALAKRCAELLVVREQGEKTTNGRGYLVNDLPVLYSMGIGSGYVAALVLGLYLTSLQVRMSYTEPDLLWVFVPMLVYWTTRLWLKTCRGEMHDDPVVFAARDRLSLACAAAGGAIIWLAM